MGSTAKTSNWMAYAILITFFITLLSCSVSAQDKPIQVSGDQLTFDGGEIAQVLSDAAFSASEKVKAQQEYAKTPEGKAKAEARKDAALRALDTTGEALKDATHWTADKVGDLAHWIEKKTK